MTDRITRVYFYHHRHTDIAYTHPQEEVAEQQAATIAPALDYRARTERRSPEARFAWTVETGWTLARCIDMVSSARGFAEVIAGAASLDAVTRARDGVGWIVRLHEIGGRPGMARLRLDWPTPLHVVPCDLRGREHVLEPDLLPFGTASWRLQP